MKMYEMKQSPVGDYLRAYSTIDGSYIGSEKTAKMFAEDGIAPEAIPGDTVASIGFCEQDQKWYGWSHRAICGFGIGSKVSKGDCAYVPTDWDDLIEDAILFWTSEYKKDVRGFRSEDDEGNPCVRVRWNYRSDVPSEKLRTRSGAALMYPPEEWGRGEWTAKTLDDAKQMAIDFAEDVS